MGGKRSKENDQESAKHRQRASREMLSNPLIDLASFALNLRETLRVRHLVLLRAPPVG